MILLAVVLVSWLLLTLPAAVHNGQVLLFAWAFPTDLLAGAPARRGDPLDVLAGFVRGPEEQP